MRKKVKKQITVEERFCNICHLKVGGDPFKREKIEIVRHLFKTEDFDAHPECLNSVIKEAFSKYF